MLRPSAFERRKWFTRFLFLVLFLHGFALLMNVSFFPGKVTLEPEAPLKIRLLDQSTRRQIVQSEDTSQRDEKKDAFLSDKTRSFERQTKARKVDSFQESAKGSASHDAKSKSATKKGLNDLKLSDLGQMAGQGDPLAQAAREYQEAKKGRKQGTEASRSISSTNDYVEEVPLGDLTHLNTVEFKYYGYYHRIRQKLEQFWGRSIQETAEGLMGEGRQIAGDEHITGLMVVMDQEGRIVEVIIKAPSGVREFDEAAIKSFNEAGPFPNPPDDLVVNGRVVIEWGFVVQT